MSTVPSPSKKPAAYASVAILCPPDNKSYWLVFFTNNSLRNLTIKSIGDLLNCLDIPCNCLFNQGIRDCAKFCSAAFCRFLDRDIEHIGKGLFLRRATGH